MAIYQLNLTAVPRNSLLEKFNRVPEKLYVDYEERKAFYESRKEIGFCKSDNYRDALTYDWWSKSDINIPELTKKIDQYVRRADWGNSEFSFSWKTYSDKLDNDANLQLNSTTGKIENLNFRADLREKGLAFLKNMTALAKEYDWLLMDVKGRLSEPTLEGVKKIIKVSDAYRFLSDPEKFIRNLEKRP
jgi:hypothetical protein